MNELTQAVRQYWNKRPCNIRHGKAPVGSLEYWEQVQARKYFVEPHIPAFADFRKWKGKKVLEIGTGIGTDAINFARAGADYWGVEHSKASLDLCCQRFETYGLKGKFFLGDAQELHKVVPKQKFDLIYSFGVLHHMEMPGEALDAASSYMDVNSELRIMLYAENSWKGIMIAEGLDQPEAQAGCLIAKTFTEPEVAELLFGYEIFSLEQTHIFPYVVEDYVRHVYTVQPWFRAMPQDVFNALSKKLGWHLLVKAKLR